MNPASPGDLLVSAQGISAGYDASRSVLHDVTVSIARGEFVGLIGPNGSGKSTLLHCLSGYHPVADGEVLVGGKAVRGLSCREISGHVAFVPQQTDLVFSFSVLEMVLMGRHPYAGFSVVDSRSDVELAEAMLRDLEIDHLRNRRYFTLSGGERQLVLLARAFAQQVPLLMLDEPLTGLDIRHQFQLMSALSDKCRDGGHGVLATFHDPGEAARWCSRMVLLRSGRIVATGAPADVMTPENLRRVYDVDVAVRDGGRVVDVQGVASRGAGAT